MIRSRLLPLAFSIVLTGLAGCSGAPEPRAPSSGADSRALPPASAAPDAALSARPRARPSGVLTLAGAIGVGLQWNPGLQIARRRSGIAEAEVVTAQQLPYNPVVSASASGDYLGTGRDREASIEVGLSQTFETGGQRGHRTEAAERGLLAARARVADEERIARREIATAFVDALLALRRSEIAAGQRDVTAELLRVAEARRRAGDIPEVEVGLVRLEARQAEAATVSAALDVEAARIALRALLGLERDAPLELAAGFPAARMPLDGDLERRAQERRADLQALHHERARAGSVLELERATRWPDLTVGVFYGFDRGQLDGAGGVALKDRDHLLGAQVGVPLPLFNRREGEILSAERELARIDSEIEALEVTIRRDVAAAREQARAARLRAALYEAEIEPLAVKNLEQTSEAFRLGQVGTLEVLRARDERYRVAAAAAEALRARAAADVALEAAIGGAP